MNDQLKKDIAEIDAALRFAHTYTREDWKRLGVTWGRIKRGLLNPHEYLHGPPEFFGAGERES